MNSVQHTDSDEGFSRRSLMWSGSIAGLVIGAVVGGTIWTHTPNLLHVVVALAITVIAMIIGLLVGMFVGLAPDDETSGSGH